MRITGPAPVVIIMRKQLSRSDSRPCQAHSLKRWPGQLDARKIADLIGKKALAVRGLEAYCLTSVSKLGRSQGKPMTKSKVESSYRVPSLSGEVIKGTTFAIVLRIAVRLLGLVSLSITARVLSPEDFGVAGTANLVIGFFLIIREMGMSDALIREKTLDTDFIRTTWTLRVITGAVITTILLLTAGPASIILNEPLIEEVILVLAFVPFIQSLASPAGAYLIRNFHFGKEFLLQVIQKIFLVLSTISLVFLLRDYWALVYSQLLATIFFVVLSQLFMPLRLLPSFKKFGSLSVFAFWSFLRSIAIFLVMRGDELVVRQLTESARFGLYHVARDLTRILIAESIYATSIAFFSVISRLQDDRARLSTAIQTMFGVTVIGAVAAATGLTLVASEVVVLILGSQWTGVVPIVVGVSIGVGAQAVSELCLRVFTVLGRQDIGAIVWLTRAILIIAACTAVGLTIGVDAIPYGFTLMSVFLALLEIGLTYRMAGMPAARTLSLWFRPVVAAGVMYLAVSALPFGDLHLAAALVGKVAAGAAVYLSALLLLWWIAGRPAGGETAIIGQLRQRIARLRGTADP